MRERMRVVVVGTGHVGLVTCASLAAVGHEVVGVDADEEKIELLRRGEMPFYEPGLESLVREQVAGDRLTFENRTDGAVPTADVVFICVGTPSRVGGDANLVYVEHAVHEVAMHVQGETLIVEKSTVPAGTAERIRRVVAHASRNRDVHVDVASNPEFLREGRAVQDALEPDRILVGAESDWAFEMMRRVYEPFTENGVPMIETDIRTAELAKHASNAFLALKISFANALARIADLAGADVESIADVMGADPRIGRAFLGAGLGYGGSCFPKDMIAFRRLASELGYEFDLLDEVMRINEEAIEVVFEKISDALWNLEGKRIAMLGLAFKPGTDDVRFSPALTLAARLRAAGATVVGYDPEASAAAAREAPDLCIVDSAYEAARNAHCIVVATDWHEFSQLDLEKLAELVSLPVLVDGRNYLDRDLVVEAGFAYYPVGRPSAPLPS